MTYRRGPDEKGRVDSGGRKVKGSSLQCRGRFCLVLLVPTVRDRGPLWVDGGSRMPTNIMCSQKFPSVSGSVVEETINDCQCHFRILLLWRVKSPSGHSP